MTEAWEGPWRAAVAKVLKGAGPETLATRTRDGIEIPPLSPAAEGAGGPWRDRTRGFAVLQRVDHPDPEAALRLALAERDGGATGFVLVVRGGPTARGFGLAPADLPAALDGLSPGGLVLRLEAAPADLSAALDAVLTFAGRQGFAADALDLDIGLDPFGQEAGATLARVKALRDKGLAGPLLRADGRPQSEAGAFEAQELAAVLSAGVAALRALEPIGLEAARAALSFTLAVEADELVAMAKLRALRRLWARIEVLCGLEPRPLRLHAETAFRMLARHDPHTNILRNTIAAASAIMGGADSLSVLPFTGALGLADAFARRLARNTSLVLLEESQLGHVADPAAGAGTFEALTDALAERAWALFQGLEAAGGLAAATAAGIWTREVAAARVARQAAIASGEASLVGVTRFANPGVSPAVLLPFPEMPQAFRDAAEAEAKADALP